MSSETQGSCTWQRCWYPWTVHDIARASPGTTAHPQMPALWEHLSPVLRAAYTQRLVPSGLLGAPPRLWMRLKPNFSLTHFQPFLHPCPLPTPPSPPPPHTLTLEHTVVNFQLSHLCFGVPRELLWHRGSEKMADTFKHGSHLLLTPLNAKASTGCGVKCLLLDYASLFWRAAGPAFRASKGRSQMNGEVFDQV